MRAILKKQLRYTNEESAAKQEKRRASSKGRTSKSEKRDGNVNVNANANPKSTKNEERDPRSRGRSAQRKKSKKSSRDRSRSQNNTSKSKNRDIPANEESYRKRSSDDGDNLNRQGVDGEVKDGGHSSRRQQQQEAKKTKKSSKRKKLKQPPRAASKSRRKKAAIVVDDDDEGSETEYSLTATDCSSSSTEFSSVSSVDTDDNSESKLKDIGAVVRASDLGLGFQTSGEDEGECTDTDEEKEFEDIMQKEEKRKGFFAMCCYVDDEEEEEDDDDGDDYVRELRSSDVSTADDRSTDIEDEKISGQSSGIVEINHTYDEPPTALCFCVDDDSLDGSYGGLRDDEVLIAASKTYASPPAGTEKDDDQAAAGNKEAVHEITEIMPKEVSSADTMSTQATELKQSTFSCLFCFPTAANHEYSDEDSQISGSGQKQREKLEISRSIVEVNSRSENGMSSEGTSTSFLAPLQDSDAYDTSDVDTQRRSPLLASGGQGRSAKTNPSKIQEVLGDHVGITSVQEVDIQDGRKAVLVFLKPSPQNSMDGGLDGTGQDNVYHGAAGVRIGTSRSFEARENPSPETVSDRSHPDAEVSRAVEAAVNGETTVIYENPKLRLDNDVDKYLAYLSPENHDTASEMLASDMEESMATNPVTKDRLVRAFEEGTDIELALASTTSMDALEPQSMASYTQTTYDGIRYLFYMKPQTASTVPNVDEYKYEQGEGDADQARDFQLRDVQAYPTGEGDDLTSSQVDRPDVLEPLDETEDESPSITESASIGRVPSSEVESNTVQAQEMLQNAEGTQQHDVESKEVASIRDNEFFNCIQKELWERRQGDDHPEWENADMEKYIDHLKAVPEYPVPSMPPKDTIDGGRGLQGNGYGRTNDDVDLFEYVEGKDHPATTSSNWHSRSTHSTNSRGNLSCHSHLSGSGRLDSFDSNGVNKFQSYMSPRTQEISEDDTISDDASKGTPQSSNNNNSNSNSNNNAHAMAAATAAAVATAGGLLSLARDAGDLPPIASKADLDEGTDEDDVDDEVDDEEEEFGEDDDDDDDNNDDNNDDDEVEPEDVDASPQGGVDVDVEGDATAVLVDMTPDIPDQVMSLEASPSDEAVVAAWLEEGPTDEDDGEEEDDDDDGDEEESDSGSEDDDDDDSDDSATDSSEISSPSTTIETKPTENSVTVRTSNKNSLLRAALSPRQLAASRSASKHSQRGRVTEELDADSTVDDTADGERDGMFRRPRQQQQYRQQQQQGVPQSDDIENGGVLVADTSMADDDVSVLSDEGHEAAAKASAAVATTPRRLNYPSLEKRAQTRGGQRTPGGWQQRLQLIKNGQQLQNGASDHKSETTNHEGSVTTASSDQFFDAFENSSLEFKSLPDNEEVENEDDYDCDDDDTATLSVD